MNEGDGLFVFLLTRSELLYPSNFPTIGVFCGLSVATYRCALCGTEANVAIKSRREY